MDTGAGLTRICAHGTQARSGDQDVNQDLQWWAACAVLAAALAAGCMESCQVGHLSVSGIAQEAFMLSHGLSVSCLLITLLRQLTQEAHLTPCWCRQWHVLRGQPLTVHCSGDLQPVTDRNTTVERAVVQGRIRTNAVEAEGLLICLGWHTHLQACMAASFRPPDRCCCAMPASVHVCRDWECLYFLLQSRASNSKVKLAALCAFGCMPTTWRPIASMWVIVSEVLSLLHVFPNTSLRIVRVPKHCLGTAFRISSMA